LLREFPHPESKWSHNTQVGERAFVRYRTTRNKLADILTVVKTTCTMPQSATVASITLRENKAFAHSSLVHYTSIGNKVGNVINEYYFSMRAVLHKYVEPLNCRNLEDGRTRMRDGGISCVKNNVI
jgi:hypothetical protein